MRTFAFLLFNTINSKSIPWHMDALWHMDDQAHDNNSSHINIIISPPHLILSGWPNCWPNC